MIGNFNHKGLKLYWEKGDASKLPAPFVNKIYVILTMLDKAKSFKDIEGYGVHPLKGDWAGFHAFTVTKNWRIAFRFVTPVAKDIDYVDYH